MATPPSTRANRRIILLSGLVPAIIVAVVALYRPAFITNLDRSVYDTMLRAAPTRLPSGRVVIVDVDDRSLSAVGQWPWRRDVLGRLVARLRELGTATIALDIVFAEADRFDSGSVSPSTDALLAGVLREGRVVLGYALTFGEGARGAGACVLHPIGLAVARPRSVPESPFFRASGAICSLPLLAQSAGASGFLNAAPDADGILRRVPLLVEFEERTYPSLALAAVVANTEARDLALQVTNVNASTFLMGDLAAPLDGRSNLLLRYRGLKRTFPYVSAADVLNGQASRETFADTIVFVGTTALGTREVVATPLDTLFAGVEVQATVADNLLQRDFLYRAEHGVALETQTALGLGLLLPLVIGRAGLVWGGVVAAGMILGLWGGAVWLLSSTGALVSPLLPTAAVATSFAAMTMIKVRLERRRADHAGRETTTSQRLMVQTLLSLTETRDPDTGRHSRRTQQYARLLSERLARHPAYHGYLTPERIDLLSSLAPLHDIGKVGVPDKLLKKPGALTPDELAEMRRHPEYGRDVILRAERQVGVRDDAILDMAKEIVYTHHERWDGSGYPRGLRGPDIPLPGRVMAIVDVYDALITKRPYSQPMSHDQAVGVVTSCRGTHFDPAVVDAFVDVSDELRRLSDAETRPENLAIGSAGKPT